MTVYATQRLLLIRSSNHMTIVVLTIERAEARANNYGKHNTLEETHDQPYAPFRGRRWRHHCCARRRRESRRSDQAKTSLQQRLHRDRLARDGLQGIRR